MHQAQGLQAAQLEPQQQPLTLRLPDNWPPQPDFHYDFEGVLHPGPLVTLRSNVEVDDIEDDIERPSHYARFPIEPVTFIMLNDLPYWAGNVVKYVSRAPFKHEDEREDIKKAIRYCEMRLEQLDREANGTTAQVINRPL